MVSSEHDDFLKVSLRRERKSVSVRVVLCVVGGGVDIFLEAASLAMVQFQMNILLHLNAEDKSIVYPSPVQTVYNEDANGGVSEH